MRLSYLIIIFFGLSIFSKSQDISTVGEIYDYEVGDIFHFESWCSLDNGIQQFQSETMYEIADKYYSPNNDTLFYIQDYQHALTSIWLNDTSWSYNTGTETISYIDLNSLINNGWTCSVYSDSSLYNGRLINSYESVTLKIDKHQFFMFVEGCGLAWHYLKDFEWPYEESEKTLVYFKKGLEEWGTPLSITTQSFDLEFSTKVKVYPNPANDWIKFDFTNKNSRQCYTIELRNLYGQLVREETNIQSTHYAMNVADLKAGVYSYMIKEQDKIIQQGKLIIK